MKKVLISQFIGLFLMGFANVHAQTETMEPMDSPQTLLWVERQADKIESMLSDAMRSSEPIEVLVRLTDCFQLFDAVAMAGLYCTNVRASAESGRMQCDVINYRLGKDLNSKLERAVEARRQAIWMKAAANGCRQNIDSADHAPKFSPVELIRQEAQYATLDLLDGMATKDLHILSQKVEMAIKVLFELEHLARSFTNCERALELAESTVLHCQEALAAPNWLEVHRSVKAALYQLNTIEELKECDW